MSISLLLQIAFNIGIFLAVWMIWAKLRRPPKDDPRLSRGLQLLQSKISVLEDLSDKTDSQVNQIIHLLDKKCREIQAKMSEASEQIDRVDQSIQKSVDVANIFEDRIPHEEIIERQKTKNYVLAAQMAHAGKSIEEISQAVDLPYAEIEIITKVNRDELMFSEELLPAWAVSEQTEKAAERVDFQMPNQDFVEPQYTQRDYQTVFKPAFEKPESLEDLGQRFREAVEQREEEDKQLEVETPVEKVIQNLSSGALGKIKEMSNDAREKIHEMSFFEEKEEAVQAPVVPPVERAVVEEMTAVAEPPKPVRVEQAVKVMVGKDEKDLTKGPTEKKMVAPKEIQRIAFPRIDMTQDLS